MKYRDRLPTCEFRFAAIAYRLGIWIFENSSRAKNSPEDGSYSYDRKDYIHRKAIRNQSILFGDSPLYQSNFANLYTVRTQTGCLGLTAETGGARQSSGDWKKFEKHVLTGSKIRQMLSVEFSAKTSKNVYTPKTSATRRTDVSRRTKIENGVRIDLKIVVCST